MINDIIKNTQNLFDINLHVNSSKADKYVKHKKYNFITLNSIYILQSIIKKYYILSLFNK